MIENMIPPEYRDFVPNVEYRLIPICDLVSNQEYQRKLSMIHVKKACENFDVNQINPVKVSRRNGINYVFNGQHTAEIIAMKSGSRETPVWCMVFEDLEYTDEADIFANQMKNVKPLSPIEIFHAKCEAGDDRSLLIRDLVESYDMKIAPAPLPGNIMAIGALESIYDKQGYDVLDRVLSLIIMTWEGDQKSFSANIFYAITRLVVAYKDELKDEIFKEKLGCVPIKELTRKAKELRTGSLGFTEAMVLFYNKKLRTPLEWNQMYAAGKADRNRKRRKAREQEKDNSKEQEDVNLCHEKKENGIPEQVITLSEPG